MNWQWRMKILFVPSNRRRLPIERVERPSLGGSQGLRPPFQYPLKWRLRARSPFVTRAEFIRVSCKFYVEARTWRQKVRIPRIEIACFIFFPLLSPLLEGGGGPWFVCHSIPRCIGSMQPTIWGTKKASKWRLREPFREIGFYVYGRIITFRWK